MTSIKGSTLNFPVHHLLSNLRLCIVSVLVMGQSVCAFDLYRDISTAISQRDSILAEQKPLKDLIFRTGTPNIASVKEFCQIYPDSENIWREYALGLISGTTLPNEHFTQAMHLAAERPGLSWILFCEFHRHNKQPWMDSSLALLHKQLLSRGGSATPLISQQLMHLALIEKDPAVAQNLNLWAARIDVSNIAPPIRTALSFLPGKALTALTNIKESIRRAGDDWRTQLAVAQWLTQWLWATSLLLAFVITATLAIKRGLEAIHPLAELYPKSVSIRMRRIFTVILTVSPCILGIIPLCLTAISVMWPRLNRKERANAVLAILLLAILPCLSIVQDGITTAMAPDAPAVLLARAVAECPGDELDSMIQRGLQEHNHDPMLLTASSLLAVKSGDPFTARDIIAPAIALQPGDPVIMLSASIADACAGTAQSAKTRLRECVRIFPLNAPALFNLGQCSIEDMETLDGMDLISRATRLDPVNVNQFMELNDLYFPKDRPSIRRFIFADYSPGYYWKTLFPRHFENWTTTRTSWKNWFLGIPPLPSAVALLLFFVVLVISSFGPDPQLSRIRKLLACEVCGVPMCRKCSKGLYCQSCFNQLRAVRDDRQRELIKRQIIHSGKLISQTITLVLEAVLPGIKDLLHGTGNSGLSILAVALMSALYMAIFTLNSIQSIYPQWVVNSIIHPLTLLCIVIVGINCIKTALQIYRVRKPAEVRHGS